MIFRTFAGIAAAALCVAAAPAMAASQWPASVVGTWSATANQSTLSISIASQGSAGECKSIGGTIVDQQSGGSSTLQGFYCPGSGRIQFLRSNGSTVFQVFTANLAFTGDTLNMGGTFAQDLSPYLGEYSFFAQK
jgi:hypothetical protein